ncbi:hypothetical protein ACFQ6N_31300 [Kitasatospora sp. NPDC056446]|uniref:hypothetical protein n=1 Tax=Kitasatospora sp. NPDC056446 TaxID=3345819 RepID=UPI0036CBF7D4
MAAGAGSWALADAARRYCGSYREEHRDWGSVRHYELPLSIAVGMSVALAAYGAVYVTVRRSDRGRISSLAPAAATALALVAMAWLQFAWLGTVPGAAGDSGLCPAGNVPGWWPRWLPA